MLEFYIKKKVVSLHNMIVNKNFNEKNNLYNLKNINFFQLSVLILKIFFADNSRVTRILFLTTFGSSLFIYLMTKRAKVFVL